MLALSLLLALSASGASATASAKEPGDLWEVTSKMSMEGMPMEMPATTQKLCSPKDWTEPPRGHADKDCETFDFRPSATTTTWKVRCAGPPAMTGEGSITRTSPDAYTGSMKMKSPDGEMTVKLSGRRIGDCDQGEARRARDESQANVEAQAAALERQAAAAQDQAASAQNAMCKSVVETMDLRMVEAAASMCAGVPLKSQFCARLETAEGFELVCDARGGSGTSLGDAAAFCGKNAEAMKASMCAQALKEESFEILATCCPVQARELAQRECAGRKYTAMAGSKYQSFCVKYAGGALSDSE